MAHGLEAVKDRVSFVSRRMPAWHNLGQVVPEDMTTEEVMALANLNDWNVRAMPPILPKSCDTHIDAKFIVRDNPFYDAAEAKKRGDDYDQAPHNLLGITGNKYEILQNEELFEFGEYLLENGRWETAGSIQHSTQVFGTIALETEITIDEQGANDTVKSYLLLSSSHDGSSSVIAGVTPVRVVCMNTLSVALGNMSSKVKIRHTKSMNDRMLEAKKTLNLTANYLTKFEETAKDMFETKVSEQKFWEIVNTVYPRPDEARKTATTRWNNRTDAIVALWDDEKNAPILETAWGAFNAITEDQQWGRAIYSGKEENFYAAGAGLNDIVNNERTRIFNIVSELTMV